MSRLTWGELTIGNPGVTWWSPDEGFVVVLPPGATTREPVDGGAQYIVPDEECKPHGVDTGYGHCPDCGAPCKSGDNSSGIKCTECDWWFCW